MKKMVLFILIMTLSGCSVFDNPNNLGIVDFVLSKFPDWNSLLALVLYWIPLLICAYGYTIDTIKAIRRDIISRENEKIYYPNITIGDIIGHVVVTILPLSNLCAALFIHTPSIFGSFFRFMREFCDIPLVPKKK